MAEKREGQQLPDFNPIGILTPSSFSFLVTVGRSQSPSSSSKPGRVQLYCIPSCPRRLLPALRAGSVSVIAINCNCICRSSYKKCCCFRLGSWMPRCI